MNRDAVDHSQGQPSISLKENLAVMSIESQEDRHAIEQETEHQSDGDNSPSPYANVVAVFVVRFDITRGNTIEWQYPQDFDLCGVEYQSLCSGLHRIDSDVIYFSKSPYLGISVFTNTAVEGERGARMRSIGVLVAPTKATGQYGRVWEHSQFLKSLSGKIGPFTDTNSYRPLQEFYRRHKLQSASSTIRSLQETNTFSEQQPHETLCLEGLLYESVENLTPKLFFPIQIGQQPSVLAGNFAEFTKLLGPDIFVLWKAALLRKRILFLTGLPIEAACGYVYDTCLLGEIPQSFARHMEDNYGLHPKFSIGINDIVDLASFSEGYVACTADAIFEDKTDLYDLLITLPSASQSTHGPGFRAKEDHDTQLNASTSLSSQITIAPLPIKSTCASISSKHNAADFVRYHGALMQLIQETESLTPNTTESQAFGELASAHQQIGDVTGSVMLRLWLWLYGDPKVRFHRPAPSWKRLFGGRRASRRNWSLTAGSNSEFEGQELLGTIGEDIAEEERDALELNNNEVYNAVITRASEEISRVEEESSEEQVAKNQISAKDRFVSVLIRFFFTLTHQTLKTLESIISLNENESQDGIILTPQNMLQLGMHPQDDAEFVSELALMYFCKTVRVTSVLPCHGCSSCFQNYCRHENRVDDGAIRI